MFKALLAASLAMLACCAAAALAGPVEPEFDARSRRPDDLDVAAQVRSPLHLVVVGEERRSAAPVLPADAAISIANVSLVASPVAGGPVPRDLPLIEPAAQPAVIPLPMPLYASILLLALTLIARRMILRAC